MVQKWKKYMIHVTLIDYEEIILILILKRKRTIFQMNL